MDIEEFRRTILPIHQKQVELNKVNEKLSGEYEKLMTRYSSLYDKQAAVQKYLTEIKATDAQKLKFYKSNYVNCSRQTILHNLVNLIIGHKRDAMIAEIEKRYNT